MPRETRAAKLVKAAEAIGKSEFTLADLVVAAWKKYPQQFGMRGMAEWPDSKTVAVELYGKRSKARERIVKVRPGVFRLERSR